MKTLISIVVPTYKRTNSLLRLLRSLRPQLDESVELIIVEQVFNNGRVFEDFGQKNKISLKYIFLKKPSTSRAKNVGVKNARGKYLLFLDDDVVVKPGLIKNHLKNFKEPKIGAVAGRVVTRGQPIEENRKDVGKITFLGHFTDGFSSLIKQEVETVIGCNTCFRRDVFEKIGGFDEKFTGNAMREESDLSLRVKKAGYKIIFEPKAVVLHLREKTGGNRKTEGRMKWYFDFFSNETYFFLKHRPKVIVPLILLTRWEWVLCCMFGFGREVSMRSILTPFKGMYDGFKKYRVKLGK